MTESEKRVWEAAFVAAFFQERDFLKRHNIDREPNGFSCAEIADSCLLALREGLTCDDAKYLEAHPFIEVSEG
jgi:hypothetical protein